MQVIIDVRETKLLERLQGVRKEGLVLGDILFQQEPYEILIERKTWCDLWSSIRDGRYREQRSRLLEYMGSSPYKKVLYLIEGPDLSLIDQDARETCRKAFHRLMIGYGIPVLMMRDIDETATWVQWIFDKKELPVLFRTADPTQERIENIQQRLDKKSIQNPQTMFISFLRSISGVSYAMASAIASRYSTLVEFVEKKNESKDHLSEILYETPSKKQRKIGPKIANKILHLLG